MNVTNARASTAAVVSPATAPDAAAQAPVSAADGAAFLEMLLQVSAAASPALANAAPGTASGDSPPTDEPDSAAPDWVAPFLPPAATAPTPLDFELPAEVAQDGGPAAAPACAIGSALGGATGDDAGLPKPLPLLVEDAGSNSDADLARRLADPARAPAPGLEQAVAAQARFESTPSGAHAIVRTIPVPVTDHRWPERVGHEVRILVDGGVQQATLRLNPEHLGPVEVRIDVVNDRASVVFGAHHSDTRAALAEAIPKLREMFAGAGLTLGDAGVRQDAPGAHAAPLPPPASGSLLAGAEDVPAAAVSVAHLGLVDAYA